MVTTKLAISGVTAKGWKDLQSDWKFGPFQIEFEAADDWSLNLCIFRDNSVVVVVVLILNQD